ncbi:RDS/peripherin-like protein xRDS35 [Caenorhabditis elegans]|uniref:RDS/peripherin-like protein xRDS35 n=1 Tax=Caenorhabditis elegans TaxID=6239 RepID=Q18833_CAEEL|nr:RDS/peripherin-like protein xRDS35 [Caenorhabditis elegans]CAA99805.3 RDS/peripherin-like protein xRDS35 [Caenorhabditis elegans]|eukprot:NP_506117.3 Uncharacterized protein CELE_C54D10.4 [Caenorhabditis elegans]
MKIRTVLLVFVFIKLCILFTVLQETIESIMANDHPYLLGTNDIYLFDVMMANVLGLSMLTSLFLICMFAIGHTRIQKPYVVVAFVINLVFVLPFFLTGIYFFFHSHEGLIVQPSIEKGFVTLKNHAYKYHKNLNETIANDTGKPSVKPRSTNITIKHLPVTSSLMNQYLIADRVQRRYCCCGYNGAIDYGFFNKTTASEDKIPFTSTLNIGCPHNSLFKNSTCGKTHSRGCEERLKTLYTVRILLYSCIGTVLSIIFAVISPFIYSQFEMDRRLARSKYIRDWRHSLEIHVNDHRMWAMRKTAKETKKIEEKNPSPVSPVNISSFNIKGVQ